MNIMKQLLLVLILPCIASAQVADGLSASGSRTVTLTADEAAFTMLASTSLDGTQQQVKQALQDANQMVFSAARVVIMAWWIGTFQSLGRVVLF